MKDLIILNLSLLQHINNAIHWKMIKAVKKIQIILFRPEENIYM